MSRLRLSSASFSELVSSSSAPRKSPSNPYILATAVPSFGGFDKAEAGKYRKGGLFRFKKKDKPFARRNTLSSCSVLTEFLEDKDRGAGGKSGKGRSVDDTNVAATTLPRSNAGFRRQSSAIEGGGEGRVGYTKNNVSIKHRYAFSKMSEGRKAQIVLLDETTLEILIQPKLFSSELLDLVSSRFNLKEKEYFGLAFRDETNHYQWLQLDRKVLEHEFIKRTGPLVLYFAIRFFIESVAYLRDSATVELFYCLAKQAIYREQIECSSDVVFELAALVLHETHGDYVEDEAAKKQLMKLPVLTTGVLKEHPSITFCEDQVIDHYKKMVGRSRGDVIVQYMTMVESLPTYGIHYYEVKDKSGIPWWLGLSYKGISLYDSNDKKTPRRVFAWSQLENLYYRERKFSIEVHDPKRVIHTLSSFNLYEDAIHEPLEDFDELSDAISDPTTQVSVSRRTFGPGNVNVHAWLAATPQLTKSIWSMAVSQHQFYLDRKQTRSQSHIARSMTDIAAELCQSPSVFSASSTPLPDGLRSVSSSTCLSSTALLSTSSASVESSGAESEANRAAQREKYAELKARKESIEEKLKDSLVKLKELCLQEANLTGELPVEYPLDPNEQAPVVRKRMGTTFALSPNIINRDVEGKDELTQLEIEYELQSKITKAAHKLIQENNDKNIRKTRQLAYQKELQKLRNLEQKLIICQKESGKRNNHEEQPFFSPVASPGPNCHHFYDYPDATSLPQLHRHKVPQMEFKRPFNGSDVNCTQAREAEDRKLRHTLSCAAGPLAGQPPQPKSAPSSPVRQFYTRQHPLAGLASPTPTRHHRVLVPSNSVRAMPQSACSHGHKSTGALHRVQRQLSNRVPAQHATSCMERDKNLYNLKTRQSDCYESGEELNVAPSVECSHHQAQHWMLASDSLCALHKTYREQVEGSVGIERCSRSNHEAAVDFSRAKMLHDHAAGFRVANPFFAYDNGVYATAQQYDDEFEYGGGGGGAGSVFSTTPMTSQPLLFQTSRSPSKDSAIHLGCSSTSICSHGIPVQHRCEPLQQLHHPHSHPTFVQFKTPPPSFMLRGDDSRQSYEGVNLSQTETMTPSPEPFAATAPVKNPNFREISKPFEMSDFYKYSERLRRQRQHDDGSQSPLRSSSSGSLPHISRSTGAVQQNNNDISSGYSSSIGNSDQATSIDGLPHGGGGCGPQEPDYPSSYQMRHNNESHYPQHIHTVGSDSRIDCLPGDNLSTRPLASVPHHSSPFFSSQAVESDIYRHAAAADKNRSNVEATNDVSFGSFYAGDGVAEAFGEEMLAWYEQNEHLSDSPDGPSTLV